MKSARRRYRSSEGDDHTSTPSPPPSVMDKIKMRQCIRFVPSGKDTVSSTGSLYAECCCGYRYDEHELSSEDRKAGEKEFPKGKPGERWTLETHTTTLPTNAYGDLEFVEYDDTGRKYVRLDVNTDMKDVKKILSQEFGLQNPTMLVSITGGAKQFKTDKSRKACFKRGLMNVLRGCGAWLVTGGTNHGAMRDVGEAIYDHRLMAASNQDVVAIGIASWGCIQDKDALINRKTEDGENPPVRYRIYGEEKKSEAFLNPHHTHYFLVDDGTQHKYGVEIPFRAKLEQAISHTTIMTSSLRQQESMSVPVVQLVLEGGPRTLQTVGETLENAIPVVIVKDSGRICDVLYHVYTHTNDENRELTEELKKTSEAMFRVFLPSEDQVARCIGILKKCLEHRELITICELTDESSGIDVPILHALLKNKRHSIFEQLSLTLSWNRADIAKEEVFKKTKYLQPSQLYEIMMIALKGGRSDFVELLIDNGLIIESFMEGNRLEQLFDLEMCAGNPHLVRMLCIIKKQFKRGKKQVTVFDIRRLLHSLIDVGLVTKGHIKQIGSTVVVEESAGRKAYLSLFIWSVLMHYQDLAKLFWIRGQNPIATALIGFGLFRAVAKKMFDMENMEKLNAYANEFADLAVGVMNECYRADERRTHLLLIRELPDFEYRTCISLAYDTWNRVFISQKAVQFLLNRVWFGNISYDNSTFRLLLAPVLAGLVCLRYKGVTTRVAMQVIEGSKQITVEENRNSTGTLPSLTDTARDPILTYSKSGKIQIIESDENGEDSKGCCQSFTSCCLIRRIINFYTAPVMVFAHNMISYFLFLLLFSYFLLIDFRKEISNVEIALYIWVFTLMVEEIGQMQTGKSHGIHSLEKRSCSLFWYRLVRPSLKYYFSSAWNRIDVLTIGLFICAVVLRFLPYDETFEAARIVYGVTLLVFFFRLLRVFSVNHEMGPKLEMIKRMMIDLTYFIVILMVFVVSYAITAYAVLHPNSAFDSELLIRVMRLGYWNIYGELFLEELEVQEPDCSFNPLEYNNGTLPRCPQRHQQVFTIVLMGMYILISNVLLLNILIAMFGNTFQKIQADTNLYWFYQRYGLIREFYEKTIFPPPLSIIIQIISAVKWIIRKCCCIKDSGDQDTALNKKLTDHQHKKLSQWEAIMAEVYLYNKELAARNTQDNRVTSLTVRMDDIEKKLSEVAHAQTQIKKPLEKLEEKVDLILRLLKNK